ncbi:FecR family protein [Pedobacter gandavensis]|uniref:FecR family protein n=1 Tax=Pedobacter gandavensis TaxID=2679963 RepID=UPI00292D4110|nr:FecR domain-containing protein [Pedobacter gandavensis]
MLISKELIERYHLGQCNPQEQDAVQQWLESDDFEMSFPVEADLNVMEDKGWKKISNRYDIVISPVKSTSFRLHNYRLILQLVACFLLFMGIASIYYFNNEQHVSQKTPLVYKTIKTLKGQKLQVKLPDGTLVCLNAESILRFPESFKGNHRTLEFSGEAYFEVAKDPSKPFIIQTSKTKVQVLGTRFNLRALATETATSVVVEEGKVRFLGKSGQQETILRANTRGIFDSSSPLPIMSVQKVDASKFIAWKNNELLLDNLTIEELAQTLERWYNVKIRISRTELAQERYTGNFNNPNLKQVLESMSFAVKFKYRQEGQTFILY